MLARRFDRVKLRVRPLHAVQVDGVDLPHPPQIVESAVALADSDTRLLLRHIVSTHRVMRRFAYGRPDQIRKKVPAKPTSAAPTHHFTISARRWRRSHPPRRPPPPCTQVG